MAIEIGGKKYKVIENLGFVHERYAYAKVVMTETGERVATRAPGSGTKWEFAEARLCPRSHVVGQNCKEET